MAFYMKRLVFDLDGTLTLNNSNLSYADKEPNILVIQKLKEYKKEGFEIIIQTARNMYTYKECIGKINANTLPIIIEWLKKHNIPYDEIHVGKPWCGKEGFYIDDRAIRPSEFTSMSLDEIHNLLEAEK